MKSQVNFNHNVDNVTTQFRRVSSDFFGRLAEKFIQKQSRALSPREKRKVLLAWASIGKHPEPEIAWIESFKRNPVECRQYWRQIKNFDQMSASGIFAKWKKPESWSELKECLVSQGYQVFPIFAPLGQELERFLASEKVLAIVPSWDDGAHSLMGAIQRVRPEFPRFELKTKSAPCFQRGVRTSFNQRELNYHLGMMKDLTYYFSTAAFRHYGVGMTPSLQAKMLDEQRVLVEDTDPGRTLRETAQLPVPFDRVGLVKGPIRPEQKWKEVYRSANTWPREVQNAAGPLLDRGEKLPDWKSLCAFSRNLGFKPVPILGWVGGPVYTRMLAKKEFPICSFWVMRYKIAPRHIVAVDALHDIGHGLSMAMPDYRDLCVRFSKETFKWSDYLNSTRYLGDYIRFFELGYAADSNGVAEAIGPVSFGLETFDFDGQILRVPQENQKIDRPYQFASREAWRTEVAEFISQLAAHKVRNLKLEPSPRIRLQ